LYTFLENTCERVLRTTKTIHSFRTCSKEKHRISHVGCAGLSLFDIPCCLPDGGHVFITQLHVNADSGTPPKSHHSVPGVPLTPGHTMPLGRPTLTPVLAPGSTPGSVTQNTGICCKKDCRAVIGTACAACREVLDHREPHFTHVTCGDPYVVDGVVIPNQYVCRCIHRGADR
jgi:hypothetical protein